ncbi:MAG: hypothetical protein M1821_009994 [Bathelium mastoideum]|nr:MAG: hypothetical protein M1821_009994 [Bathelium mastoideum]
MDPHMPQSPSLPLLPSWSPDKQSHVRTSSDVQGMVARFNSLEINDHAEMRRRDELALRKAEMGREQAEARMEKLREELRRMQKEGAESRDRERRMAKRIESLTEEKVRREETHAHAQGIYEKEIRKARKDQYKSESFLVKAQEELKMCRKQLNAAHVNIDIEKAKATQREQDAFKAEYKFVGVQEELTKAQERIKIIEEERDVLKTSLKEEEVARVAAEGRIALPTSRENEDDEFASPRKSPSKRRILDLNEDKENVSPQRAIEVTKFREELAKEKIRRVKAEETVEFMKIECQFERCSCRVAERKGSKYVHDIKFTTRTSKPRQVPEKPSSETDGTREHSAVENGPSEGFAAQIDSQESGDTMDVDATPQEPRARMSFSPESGTFHKIVSGEAQDVSVAAMPMDEDMQAFGENEESHFARSTTPAYPPPTQVHDDTTIVPDEPTLVPQNPPTEEITAENDGEDEDQTIEDQAVTSTPSSPKSSSSEPSSPTLAFSSNQPSPSAATTAPTPSTPKLQEIHTTTTIPVHFTPQPNPTQPLPFSPSAPSFPPSPSTIHLPALPPPPFTPTPTPTAELPAHLLDAQGQPLVAPATIDRAAALEAIRQRRGRARSFAEKRTTPQTPMGLDGLGAERRDISAPVLGTASASKVNVQRVVGRSASRGKK